MVPKEPNMCKKKFTTKYLAFRRNAIYYLRLKYSVPTERTAKQIIFYTHSVPMEHFLDKKIL